MEPFLGDSIAKHYLSLAIDGRKDDYPPLAGVLSMLFTVHRIQRGKAMLEHKRTIIHHHKLETSIKLILAAIAVALAMHTFVPMLSSCN